MFFPPCPQDTVRSWGYLVRPTHKVTVVRNNWALPCKSLGRAPGYRLGSQTTIALTGLSSIDFDKPTPETQDKWTKCLLPSSKTMTTLARGWSTRQPRSLAQLCCLKASQWVTCPCPGIAYVTDTQKIQLSHGQACGWIHCRKYTHLK